jgi:hypothetical protein
VSGRGAGGHRVSDTPYREQLVRVEEKRKHSKGLERTPT